MNALSCFDGMSCLQIALQRMGRKVDNYYASEIDKHAIRATQLNFPNTIQLGDIQQVHAKDLPRLDLIAGGSPCQGFSFAGKGLNFEDPRSKLFFEFVRLVNEAKEINPDIKFLMENVMMEKWCQDVISKMLGVNPIRINSALVSAQNRDRLYWTNIGLSPAGLFGDMASTIVQPKDKGLVLANILEEQVNEKYYLSDTALARIKGRENSQSSRIYPDDGKSITLQSEGGGGYRKTGLYQIGVLNNNGTLVESNEKANCIDANFHKGMDNHSPLTMVVQKIDIHGNLKANQKKASCFTAGGNSGGNHSDMDLLQIHVRRVVQINENKESGGVQPYQQNRIYSNQGLHPALNAELSGRNNIEAFDRIRRLTPVECCRLQTVPDNYFTDTDISETQQYRMLGNGWTIDVIVHILSYWK
jgi:site-specific DNA-cytosine methylase